MIASLLSSNLISLLNANLETAGWGSRVHGILPIPAYIYMQHFYKNKTMAIIGRRKEKKTNRKSIGSIV